MRVISLRPKSIHIVLYADRMFCYAVAQNNNGNFIVEKKEHSLTPALTPTLIYNPTQMLNTLNAVIAQHHMYKSYLCFVLAPPLAQEELCMHPKNHASLQELIRQDPERTYHHRYVGSIDERALFYISSITKTLLFQLQLICKKLPCYVQAIQPFLSTQHALYNYIQPSSTAHAQIAKIINPQTLHIQGLSESPSLHALVSNKDMTQDKNLIYALGSFVGAYP